MLKSLDKCGIQIQGPAPDACPWYSSVTEDNERVTMSMASALKSIYRRDNMLQPVLFSQALKAAVTASGLQAWWLKLALTQPLRAPPVLPLKT